jgi:hypothetical protein
MPTTGCSRRRSPSCAGCLRATASTAACTATALRGWDAPPGSGPSGTSPRWGYRNCTTASCGVGAWLRLAAPWLGAYSDLKSLRTRQTTLRWGVSRSCIPVWPDFRRVPPGMPQSSYCFGGLRRATSFCRNVASVRALSMIALYSSTERPWSVTALTSASFASPAIRALSEEGAAASL